MPPSILNPREGKSFLGALFWQMLLTLAMVVLIGGATRMWLTNVVARKDMAERGNELIASISSACAVPLWQIDRQTVSYICDSYIQGEAVDAITVLDDKGDTVFARGWEDIAPSRIGHNELERGIAYRNRSVGTVSIHLSDRFFNRLSMHILLGGGFLVLGVMITGLVVAMILLAGLQRRFFNEFARAVDSIAAGKTGGAVSPYVELRPFLQHFSILYNRIAGQVATLTKAQVELAELNHSLEDRVAARTADLAAANDELDAARARAESANEAKSAFFAAMTHELRTPLNAILGYAQLIQRRTDLPLDVTADMGVVQRSGDHLLSLINDVLDIAKVEAGRFELVPVVCSPAAEIETVVDIMQVQARARGVALVYKVTGDLPAYARLDARHLRQVLLNLLGNAFKFTLAGEVCLTVGVLDNSRITCSIRDTGPGMSAEDLAGLFSLFAQTAHGRAQSEGTGLGLYLSKAFVEGMGGTIAVESIPGQGTTFTFDVVYEALAASEQAHGECRGDASVLVVDDTDFSRILMTRFLAEDGVAADTAASACEALELISQKTYGLIISDINMPGMSGIEFAACLVKQYPVHPPVVICSSADRPEILPPGIAEWLPKPFRLAELSGLLLRFGLRT